MDNEDSNKILPLVDPEEIKEALETAQKKADQAIYLRLTGIYEADVEVEPGKHVTSVMLHFLSIDGQSFVAPCTVPPSYQEKMRRVLGQLEALVISFPKEETEKKEQGSCEVIDLKTGEVIDAAYDNTSTKH